jgi:hypothetical protein
VSAGLARLAGITEGSVAPASVERILALLTTGEDGFPRHCALSRNEIEVADERVHVAIHARRAGADIQRTGTATLVAVDGTDILSYRLRLEATEPVEGTLALRFTLSDCEVDSLGIPLQPATFVATSAVAELDHWEATRRALAAIRRR